MGGCRILVSEPLRPGSPSNGMIGTCHSTQAPFRTPVPHQLRTPHGVVVLSQYTCSRQFMGEDDLLPRVLRARPACPFVLSPSPAASKSSGLKNYDARHPSLISLRNLCRVNRPYRRRLDVDPCEPTACHPVVLRSRTLPYPLLDH